MKLTGNYYVYIVQCRDGFYYTGVTNDLDRRLEEHNQGVNRDCFTYKRRPVTLKYAEHFTHISPAIEREKQIKGWSRAKKRGFNERGLRIVKKAGKKRPAQDPSINSG